MYKLHLILKYLLKRRIAWVSLFAVMLCTTMVLVVISVMGGWLNMFKSSFRGLSGDIVIHSESLQGFAYYGQIIDALVKDPEARVQAAVPSIETYGLFNYGTGPVPVRVMGIPIAQMGTVNKFPESLYLQHSELQAALDNPNAKLSTAQRERLDRKLRQPPSFDLLDQVTVPMDTLPQGLALAKPAEGQELAPGTIALPADAPEDLRGRLRFDAIRHNLVFKGEMKPAEKDALAALSADPKYKQAIDTLQTESHSDDLIPYDIKGKANGLIVGVGVIGVRRTPEGKWDRPGPVEFERPVSLTVLDLSGGKVDTNSQVSRNYFIVDDSHIGVWQYDNSYVYVPFDVLQKDLGLDPQKGTIDGVPVELPGRVTDIHIKVKDGIDPNDEAQLLDVRDRVQQVVHRVTQREQAASGDLISASREPIVETWQDTQRIWISAVENEKLLTVVLFDIISLVAIFLIFCIFYMIVAEKTRDIGIIKSVGATSAGVASIFLGYGLVIGIVGSAMGLLLSYLIVHFINQLHALLGKLLHVQIWNPEVYLFDKIPNTMSGRDIAWIVPIAILASVLGALVPALRAASVNPVESLRWE